MSIQKVRRAITEKITSVEDLPIELVQRGTVALTTVSTYLPIPTTIEVPYSVHITPLSATTMKVLYGGSAGGDHRGGFYTNLTKVTANSISGSLNYASSVTVSTIAGENIALKSGALYQAVRGTITVATATAGLATVSPSLWKKVPFFSSNAAATNFLKVQLTSVSSAQAVVRFAYEVRGYNNS